MKVSEVKNDYIDDQNYCHIDCYLTEDENEAGKTVAIVDIDNGKVYFLDNLFRDNEMVIEAIKKVKSEREMRPFVRLTVNNLALAEGVSKAIGKKWGHSNGEQWDFYDIDLEPNISEVLRYLGRPCGEHYFSTEEIEP